MQKSSLFRAPSLFISHGAPTVALVDDSYAHDLKSFGDKNMPGLKGIVCISAHGISAGPLQIASSQTPGVVHDFRGFQKELYELDYPAKGSPELSQRILEILKTHKRETELNPRRQWDHGVWIPLRLLRPQADIPVVQVSLPMGDSPRELLKLGKILSELRNEGIMILTSGGAVHNLSEISWHAGPNADQRIMEFNEWLVDNVKKGKIEELLNFETQAPHSSFAHPTTEHLLPLFVSLGAALPGDQFELVTQGYKYNSLSMFSFALKANSTEKLAYN